MKLTSLEQWLQSFKLCYKVLRVIALSLQFQVSFSDSIRSPCILTGLDIFLCQGSCVPSSVKGASSLEAGLNVLPINVHFFDSSFTEMQSTSHTIHPLVVQNSIFSIIYKYSRVSKLYNYHYNLLGNIFIISKRNLYPQLLPPISSISQPEAITNLLSVSIDLFWRFHINVIL